MKRILSIDGGGIRGVFPASFLATLEDIVGGTIAEYFDLIVGTSTGGVIALGLGLGISARELLAFYEEHGPRIFSGHRKLRWLRRLALAKYDPAPLRHALQTAFGEMRLGQSTKRLVIPSYNMATHEVHLYKTAHHPRLQLDYKCTAVEVALATAAAPTFFPTFQADSGIPLIDGGMWANNPVTVAIVEAISMLNWPRDQLRVLSVGCTSAPIRAKWEASLGALRWAIQIADVFMAAQAASATGMAQHLLLDRANLIRISPPVGDRYEMDDTSKIPVLKGIGLTEARKALHLIQPLFLASHADAFIPCYQGEQSTHERIFS